MAAVPLVLQCHLAPARKGGQRGEDVRELCSNVVVQGFEKSRLESVDVLVQRIDEDGERQILFEL